MANIAEERTGGMYYHKSLQKYLKDLEAKQATPGGGSAAALTAAMGASLIGMVVNFTLGKPRYIRYNTQLKRILAQSTRYRKEFLRLVDEDVKAYKSKNIRRAMGVPLEVCGLCEKAISVCPILVSRSSRALISDVAVAAILLEAAFMSAAFNVEINLGAGIRDSMKKKVRRLLAAKEKKIKRIRYSTEEAVGAFIRR
jgi:formiminotetrahydrofolate cyclodeaminase